MSLDPPTHLEVGQAVYVRQSTFPAKIVAFLPDERVEIQWQGDTNNYERIFARHDIKPAKRTRNRTKTAIYTEAIKQEQESDDQGGDDKKKGARGGKASMSKKKRAPRKPRAIKKGPPIKRTIQPKKSPSKAISRKPKGNKPPPPNLDYSRLNGVARLPAANNDDDDSSSSTSVEDLIAQSRRLSTPLQSRLYSSGSVTEEDGRKPAAKTFSTTGDSSSSDEEDTIISKRTRRPTSKHFNNKKPSKARGRKRQSLLAQNFDGINSSSSSEPEANEKNDIDASAIKQEEGMESLAPIDLYVGDFVWIQDGAKHMAEIVGIMPNDMLRVKWSNGMLAKKLFPKSVAEPMFDLTGGQSKRSRRKPERFGTPSQQVAVKKESPSRRRGRKPKKNTGNENAAAAARPPKYMSPTTRSRRKKTKQSVRRTTKKKPEVIAIDLNTTTDDDQSVPPPARAHDSVAMVDSYSDSDSDAGTVDTEATFEYPAPGIDPRYGSLHRVTNVTSFMKVEPWNMQKPVRDAPCQNAATEAFVDGINEHHDGEVAVAFGSGDDRSQHDHVTAMCDERGDGIQVNRSYEQEDGDDDPAFGADDERDKEMVPAGDECQQGMCDEVHHVEETKATQLDKGVASAMGVDDDSPSEQEDMTLVEEEVRVDGSKIRQDGGLDSDEDDSSEYDDLTLEEMKRRVNGPTRSTTELVDTFESHPFAASAAQVSHDSTINPNRQSTETANPEELPDILMQHEDDLEPAERNEERLTADSQELTRAFAAFGESDLSTQPEAMCSSILR